MSIFKSKWIIIKVEKVNWSNNNSMDNKLKTWEFLYTIFTREYWKIKCNKKISKQEKNLDLWYIVNFEITTKENASIHKIKNIKITSEFNTENKSFLVVNSYLEFLALILKNTPNWVPVYELFDLVEIINNYSNVDEIKLILAKLKTISILWELNDNYDDEYISKILKFINHNKIDRILKLTWFTEEIVEKLRKIKIYK